MMNANSERAMIHYTEAYQKLYQRTPKDLRDLGNDWVIVNGARMRVAELEYLTAQLQLEYRQSMSEKRSLVAKLLKFFKQ